MGNHVYHAVRGNSAFDRLTAVERITECESKAELIRDALRVYEYLDGEIVRPGPDGRPMFYELMRRHGPFCFYAFDLLWLDGSDLRDRTLLERKRLLRKLLPRRTLATLYLDHFTSGMDLFRVICDRDMEGVVAKQASAKYTPEACSSPVSETDALGVSVDAKSDS